MGKDWHRYSEQWKLFHSQSFVEPRIHVAEKYRHPITVYVQLRPTHSLRAVSHVDNTSQVLTLGPEMYFLAFYFLLPESERSPRVRAEHDGLGCHPFLYVSHRRDCCTADTSSKGLLVSIQAGAVLIGCRHNMSF